MHRHDDRSITLPPGLADALSRTNRSSGPPSDRRRRSAAMLEQFVYSLSNVGLIAIGTSALGASEGATFAALTIPIVVATTIGRALVATPFLVLSSSGDLERAGRREVAALLDSALVALACAAGAAAVLSVWASIQLMTVVLVAVAAGLSVVQDQSRHVAFSRHRYARALIGSTAWCVALVAMAPVGRATGLDGGQAALASWTAGCAVACVVNLAPTIRAMTATERFPDLRPFEFLREVRDSARPLVSEQVAGPVIAMLVLPAAAIWLPVSTIGRLRIAQSAVGVTRTFVQGLTTYLTVAYANGARDGHERGNHDAEVRRVGQRAGILTLVCAVPYAVLAPPLGDAMFGAVWHDAFDYGYVFLVVGGLLATRAGFVAELRARGEFARLLWLRLAELAAVGGGALLGAALFGISGYLTGILLGSLIAAATWATHADGARRPSRPSRSMVHGGLVA